MRVDTPSTRTAVPQATEVRSETVEAVASAAKVSPPAVDPVAIVRRAAERIQEYLRESQRELSFTVDGGSGRVVVTITDPTTGEEVRQIPSEEVLRIARHLSATPARLVDLLA